MSARFDLAIMGGGPAASAAAITARQVGLRCVVIARVARGGEEQFGECLSPAAAVTLRQFGMSPALLDIEHRACFGTASAWGSPELHRTDAIHDPRGHGWHIDRPRFEAQLRDHARQLGAEWRTGRGPLDARMIIDATGRAAAFARRHGARRLAADRQIAWVMVLRPTGRVPDDTTTWIEAAEHGWWYSAIVPSGRMVVVLFTDPDVRASIDDTVHTRQRIEAGGYQALGAPRRVAAGGSRLSSFAGAGWFAAGDAAMAYDPLSGHGLTVALQSGRDAALAVAATLGGDAAAASRYEALLAGAYQRYASLRRAYYQQERRWPDAPYWQRRQNERDAVRQVSLR